MRLITFFSLILTLYISNGARAQSLATTVQQIKHIKTSSYTETVKFKYSFQDNFSIDTLKVQIAVMPNERQMGGYYKIKGKNNIYLYDGKKAILLNLKDTTYKIANNAQSSQYTDCLLYWEKLIEKHLKTPSQIKLFKDTVINHVAYNHFLITGQDTVENNAHLYSFIHIIIDKITSLPYLIRCDIRTMSDDKAVIGFTEEHVFKAYKNDEKNFPDLSNALVPDNFKMPIQKAPPIPLANGTKAPKINLYDAAGNNLDLEKLKGKVVLLNFTVNGCPHCVNAAQMLTRLSENYKSSDFTIISIYQLGYDDKTSISKFDKKFNIKYSSYLTEKTAERIYHFQGYPYFFLLDKQGAIVQGYEGFYASLEKELTDKIDRIK